MHSFQPSRGRILFEVLCALAVAASLAGAWLQTGATALLPAAGVAALCGLVHLFDMRRKSADPAEPQRVDFATEEQGRPQVQLNAEEPIQEADERPEPEPAIEQAELAEPAVPRTTGGRRKGGSRKGSGRRASEPKPAVVAELTLPEEADVLEPLPIDAAPVFEPAFVEGAGAIEPETHEETAEEVAEIPETGPGAEAEATEPEAHEEVAHLPVAPLFEPEPFARQPRAVFGRKAG